MTSVDGVQLRQTWNAALDNAQTQLQSLLTSATSPLWRRVPSAAPETAQDGSSTAQEESHVIIHKRPSKQGEIFRLILDIPVDGFSIAAWKAVLATPEMRHEWDPAAESSQLLELLEVDVRVVKTDFTLGWPAAPRDAVTISRTLSDGSTLLDVTTSLPRSPDEPPYLRPTPPYVRSHVHLFAWVIQQVPSPAGANIRLTCFWQHDLKAVWGLGMPSRVQHLSSLMIGAVKAVKRYGTRIPLLQGYGLGVGMERMAFDVGRQSLTVEYSILHEEEGDDLLQGAPRGMDEVLARKEKRRLEKSLEFVLPKQTGWDIQLLIRASSAMAASSPWAVKAYSDKDGFLDPDQLLLRARHSLPSSMHAVIKVKLVIEAAGGTAGNLRLNGVPLVVEDLELRDPTPLTIPEPLLQDASNVGDISFQSPSGAQSQFSDVASRTISVRANGRTEGSQKSILKLVKRNYVYFSSLIQEPEMKWKPLVEARGVSVTQLDSIDPTLVVYKAEAVFVGVGMWDLISVISTPGATMYWDKSFDGANLLEDVSELSQLWHHKTKAAWPVNARESVLLRSTYKSPTSVHIFSFSTDDIHLFPSIPPSDPSVIRTQVDLRGWAIEALSPTTTQVTLIEQSDPKGWSNKSSLPQQIIAAVSGVGEFVIKSGGPPVLSRLGGARALINRYDFEKANFRLDYEVDASRRAADPEQSTPAQSSIDLTDTISSTPPSRPFVECELRCDIETWGGPIDVVVDPPPQAVSCLRRHRLSENGGGLWITIEHDADFVAGERLKVVVRKGTSSTAKEKNTVLINGAKTKVEVEELPEAEIKQLSKRKRVKPVRIPLDQPPVVSAIRRRRAEWAVDNEGGENGDDSSSINTGLPIQTTSTLTGNTFGRLMSMAFSQATSSTSTAMSAVAKPFALTEQTVPTATKSPMQHALDAMAYLRSLYTRPPQEGWVQVADNGGLAVLRKLETEVSRTIPVHKASKVIEGVTAEEVIHALSLYDCRKQWDDRFDSAVVLQDYGYGCLTSFTVVKGAFPFQPRGFYTASTLARSSSSISAGDKASNLSSSSSSNEHAVYYHATTSFNPESIKDFSSRKYNPSNYAIGRVLVRGWICETLDPYTSENYAIPSTRCTFVSAVDFAGAVPVAYNAMLNASLPRAILRLESYLKSSVNLPVFHTPIIGIAVEPTEGPQEGWSFQRRDAGSIVVARRYGHEKKEYQATVVIDPTSVQSSNQGTDITPTPSRLIPPASPPSPTPGESFSVSPPGAYAPIHDLGRPKSPDRASFRDISIGRRNQFISSSMERRRPAPSFSASSSLAPKDYLVADLVVDSKLYPQGFDILVSPGSRVPEEYADLAHTYSSGEGPFPLNIIVYALSNSLYRSSYSERSGSRYLVRLSLPTARFEGAPLEDPLTGQIRSPPPRPSWLLEIMEKGATMDISLLPSDVTASSPTSQANGFKVTHNGQPVDIISERKALTMLGKDGSDLSLTMPWVLRSDDATFPKELMTPIAVAKQYLVEPVPEPPGQTEPESIVEANQKSESVPTEIPREVPPTPRPGLGSIFNTYASWWPKKVSTIPTPPASGSLVDSDPEGKTKLQVSSVLESTNGSAITMTGKRPRGLPLHIVFVVAVICFLLGSLVRSILSPTDFIIIKGPEELVDFDERQWRRFSRLVEFKWIWRGNDLIIGIAHA